MKAAIISLGSVSSKWTAEAMKKYFDTVEEIQIKNIEVSLGSEVKILYNGKSFDNFDCVLLKGSYKFVKILSSIASALEGTCYMPLSADSFTIGHDKLLTHLKLQQRDIPMPATYISSTPLAAKTLLEKVNYPIVFKFPNGTQGKGVMFADSYSSALSLLDAMTALNQPVIIQEYIETDGCDIRAIVVGRKVVAAMKRKSSGSDKRSNMHAGGSGEPVELDFETKQIAIKASESVNAEICGVDILLSDSGAKVIEVNLSPGLQGITEVTGIDVADEIAKYLYSQTKKRSDVGGYSRVLDDLKLSDDSNGVIASVEIKDKRIVLPEIITKWSQLKKGDEVIITAEKGSIGISKSK